MSTAVDDPEVVAEKEDINENMLGGKKVKIIFVLGGPGSGKGTQCCNIVEHFGFTHLSAGDLLRAEINSGSENGTMIDTIIKEGKIVPSEVTIKLLQEAIIKSGNDKFIIDGFPRNEENRAAFESVINISPEFVLFFDCSEEEMERRLLGRNQGRSDDNIETIRKRFKVFVESSFPVIEYYDSKGIVKKIDATKPVPEVFEDVKAIFHPYGLKVLVGMGFKGVKIMRVKNLDLYAFGLYLQPNTISEKLGPKYASVPTIKLKDSPDFYDDLLRENLPMRVRLVVHYNGLSIGAVRDVFEKSLGLRLQKMNPNTDYHCLKTFGSYFNEDIPIPAGTKIDFCQTSDGQLITEIDGRQIGAVKSKDLCRALFGMYIGDSPVSLEAKKDIGQNVAGLMGKC
ncbi:hypothetical protein E2562_018061 [Oryza meyeriana var. granulata]|uniref:UMP-CMP kinase n=1 Tax=Oryza meyeriana var. granulata TaxID=110450 RepID=A0A6G1CPN5_9ORYZ|nr:hypothetical protein E2562_018061 [Oryza meyeriana var. granulata]